MARPNSQYPATEKYLANARVSKRIQAAKRPSEWIKWLFLVAAGMAIGEGAIWVGFGIAGLSVVFQILTARLVQGGFAGSMRLEMDRALQRKALKLVRAGRWESVVGQNAARYIEQCSESVLRATTAMVTASMSVPFRPSEVRKTIGDSLRSAEGAMDQAFRNVQRAVIHGVAPADAELNALVALTEQLEGLAEAAESVSRTFTQTGPGLSLEAQAARLRSLSMGAEDPKEDLPAQTNGS